MKRKRVFWGLGLLLIFALGLGIRLYDLTDPPFDYHPTRQFHSALVARGMYFQADESAPDWQRTLAIKQWDREPVIEPPVMELLVAGAYRLMGSDNLWVARLLSAVFWVLGGIAIMLFGRQLGYPLAGVLAGTYYLFLPYGMIASRAFQPDPLMVALMAGAFWAAARWRNRPSRRSALLVGLLAGAAVFVKTTAAFILGGALTGLILWRLFENHKLRLEQRLPRLQPDPSDEDDIRKQILKMRSLNSAPEPTIEDPESVITDLRSTFRNPRTPVIDRESYLFEVRALFADVQVWIIALFALTPTAIYYVYGLWIDGFLQQQMNLRFFPTMWLDPAFYIRWVEMSSDIVGFIVMLAAILGITLFRDRAIRGMALGMWLGYFLYSMTFPFHTITHDYYQLPLIPIISISLIPVLGMLLSQITRLDNKRMVYGVLALIVLFGVLFKVWDTRVILARQDYRDTPTEWARFEKIIPQGQKVIAITKAYGFPLAYFGWVDVTAWLSESDASLRALAGVDEEEMQARRMASLEGKDLFLITNFNELERQGGLSEFLSQGYEIFDQGGDYLIYDLNRPK